MEIKDLIRRSFGEAKATNVVAESDRVRNNKRSSAWVEALAANFRAGYKVRDTSVKVFSRGYKKNRKNFGMNELLYDITVCSVAKVDAATRKKKLSYITKAHWQVESEFAKNSRQAIIDFNKLVLGSADNKLFIGPIVHDQESFRETLAAPAGMCSGNVYAAFLPHPGEWDENVSDLEVFQFIDDKWVMI